VLTLLFLSSYQLCFPKLRNIEDGAEDHYRHHIASHPSASGSSYGAVTVVKGAADSIESDISYVNQLHIAQKYVE
jgi:hypothetical protein